jgi:hypothetical protein
MYPLTVQFLLPEEDNDTMLARFLNVQTVMGALSSPNRVFPLRVVRCENRALMAELKLNAQRLSPDASPADRIKHLMPASWEAAIRRCAAVPADSPPAADDGEDYYEDVMDAETLRRIMQQAGYQY